jgi:flagellar motor component MotA
MKKTYPVYLILTLIIFALGIWMARGSYGLFFDPPSIMIVFLPVILMLLTCNTPAEILNAFKVAMNDSEADEKELKKALSLMEIIQSLTYKIAILAFIFGFVLMMASGWKIEEYGKGFATAILGIVYALFAVIMITLPFKMALKKKLIEIE